MSLLTHLIDRLPEGIQRAEDTIIGSSLILSLTFTMCSELFMTLGLLDPNSEARLMTIKQTL
jgi:hypothetical protein